jgi:hypothetical protein
VDELDELDEFPVAVGSEPNCTLYDDRVGVAPSSDKICMSVFCHSTGIASHNAEVSLGTIQSIMLRSDGRLIGTWGVGFGAGQTLVSVCPEDNAVLQPCPERIVDPPTQPQFLDHTNQLPITFRKKKRLTKDNISLHWCHSPTWSRIQMRSSVPGTPKPTHLGIFLELGTSSVNSFRCATS